MSYCEISVGGRNQALLFEKLRRAKIDVLWVNQISENLMVLRVRVKDCRKFFAISGDMWYNKLIKFGGIYAVFDFFKKRLTLFVGIITFLLAIYFANDFIFSVDINGLSNVPYKDVKNVVEGLGAVPFSRFSLIDIEEIESKVLTISDDITFVTAKKVANRLIINVTTKELDNQILPANENKIVSLCDGVVKRIVVYRGTATVGVGDWVNCYDTLIEGVYRTEDSAFETIALGYVIIESTFVYEYTSSIDSIEEECNAIALAKFNCPASENSLGDIELSKTLLSDGCVYTVSVKYLVEIGG